MSSQTTYYCDRCGKCVGNEQTIRRVKIIIGRNISQSNLIPVPDAPLIDNDNGICQLCRKEVEKLLKDWWVKGREEARETSTLPKAAPQKKGWFK